jgi:DNA-binding NarL/FixJ family response regulator
VRPSVPAGGVHPLLHEAGIRALRLPFLVQTAGFVVVGEAVTGEASIHAARGQQPDLVLMDSPWDAATSVNGTRRIFSQPPLEQHEDVDRRVTAVLLFVADQA